jgi:hypothetical protein
MRPSPARPFLAFSLATALALLATPSAAGTHAEDEEQAARPSAREPGTEPQTIRVEVVPVKTYLDPDFEIDAEASSGLPVRFAASGDCSVRRATVRILAAGRCTVTVSQPGDDRWAAAPAIDVTIPIAKAEQRIRLPNPPPRAFLDPDFELDVTASSRLPVVLIASGECEVDGVTARLLGAGSCSVQAHQPGDSNFTAARIVEATFPIARAPQRIDFRLSGTYYRTQELRLNGSSSSGLPVRYDASGSCVAVGQILHLVGEGLCLVNADQPGDRNFDPAPTVSRTITVFPI